MRQEYDQHATATQHGPGNGRRIPVQGSKHSPTVGAGGPILLQGSYLIEQ
jgi:hypothetical protein